MAARPAPTAAMTPNIYRYVVRSDSGVAPRPFNGYCTLAICKPVIRSHASVGDWIIGFRSRAPGEVIYLMHVEEVLTFAQYWRDRRFRNRRPSFSTTPDNIYRPGADGTLKQVPNAIHRDKLAATDLKGRNVLVSRRYWYFGKQSPVIATDLVHLVHTGIGHAVHKNRRQDDADRLARWVAAWRVGIHGEPVDAIQTEAAGTPAPQARQCQPAARRTERVRPDVPARPRRC